MRRASAIVALALALVPFAARAGGADVIAATAEPAGDGTYRVSATVRHADEGWDHYANAFEVLMPDGTLLGTRTLHHPHVDEQPFTRSLGGVRVPEGTSEVVVRAVDSVHGHGGSEVTVALPDREPSDREPTDRQ